MFMNVIKILIKIWMGGVGQWLAYLTRNRWTWGVGSNLIKGSPSRCYTAWVSIAQWLLVKGADWNAIC